MPVKIRLMRPGKSSKKKVHFRVVVIDSKKPRDGKFIEEVGLYNPTKNPPLILLKKERIKHWLKQGAKLSQTVSSLMKKARSNEDITYGAKAT